MTERGRNIAVGLTAIVALAGLGVIVTLFGYVPDMLEKGYAVTVQMPGAGGLTPGSRVRLSGIDIGRVTEVTLRPAPEVGVLAVLKIREGVRVPAAANVVTEAPVLGGGPAVKFDLTGVPREQLGLLLATDGSAIVRGRASSMVGKLAAEMRDAIEGPATRFDKLAGELETLSKEWVLVARNVNQMFEARDPAAVDAGEAAANLTSVLARADARLKQLQATVAGLEELVNDPQLQRDIRATASNSAKAAAGAAAAAEKADATLTQAQQTLADAGRDLDTLTKRYVAVADDLSGVIGAMKQTVDAARAGDGTVAKLLNDPALYQNLNDAAQRVGLLLDELRLLVEKWKKEGLDVNL